MCRQIQNKLHTKNVTQEVPTIQNEKKKKLFTYRNTRSVCAKEKKTQKKYDINIYT